MQKRVFVIVLDSLGVGEAPDAAAYGDGGADTLGHIKAAVNLSIPNLESLGLGVSAPERGFAGRLYEESAGKDTLTGHWELMGLVTREPFPTYPGGFPAELLKKLTAFSGRGILCNLPYSGTKAIDDYGPRQMKTGELIVYTSADPVLQIAAHEEIIPLKELYAICEYARRITLEPPFLMGRIIARPFLGSPGSFYRTANRHDYAIDPPGKTALDALKERGRDVIAIGKIGDIFNMRGITESRPTKSNKEGVEILLETMRRDFNGLCFLNLVDFDMLYGHRRDPAGYGAALEDFDRSAPEIISRMLPGDLLVITADHGTDPCFKGADHTREYVPVLLYAPGMERGGALPDRPFSYVAELAINGFM